MKRRPFHPFAGATALALGFITVVPGFAQNNGSRAANGQSGYASPATLASGTLSRGGSVDVRPASASLKRGLEAVRRKDVSTALKIRARLSAGSIEHKTLSWAIGSRSKNVPVETLLAISGELAGWPASRIRLNLEKALTQTYDQAALRVAFSKSPPESTDAAIALARAHKAGGNVKNARQAIRPHWRSGKLTPSQEARILKHLKSVLTRDDHRARVEYLLSKRRIRGAERIAGSAGMTRLVAARAAVERKQSSARRRLAAVPSSQKGSANYLFSKARHLRNGKEFSAAASTLLSIGPKDIHTNAADQLWTEHRILAGDLIETGKAQLAYRIASRNVAASTSDRIDAEFYAGWIALRKLRDAKTASRHFQRIVDLSGRPLSKSRGHYWMARARAQSGDRRGAKAHYKAAARYDTTYYGQLALHSLGGSKLSISRPRPTSRDRRRFGRYELVQTIAKLESAGRGSWARVFYRHLAHYLKQPGELALLAARAEKRNDHKLALQVGKRAVVRGFDAETLAWPVGAIPTNTRTSGVGLPLAYAIARQESTFQVDARSPANALGLLQLLPTTARRTARSIGIGYSRNRLISDAAYNARLGTAYLDQQMGRFGGSFVLTFVAYNAGPGRARDWIERFGDPRGRSLEAVIDWVEQIPFSETRNYVQRVMENYQIYKSRLRGRPLTIARDLRAGRG